MIGYHSEIVQKAIQGSGLPGFLATLSIDLPDRREVPPGTFRLVRQGYSVLHSRGTSYIRNPDNWKVRIQC